MTITDHTSPGGMNEVRKAVEILKSGGVVAFPTETVYGLAADARNENAVNRLFAIKGRPADHPLIVHIADTGRLAEWVDEIPDTALTLAKRFWPGPLTMVLRRHPSVSAKVTGGLDTVAVRIPGHALALSLLNAFDGGLAAPSANRFGRVSPTIADHVRDGLGNDVDLILDGGPCAVGIESTIVDVSSGEPRVLRPGSITREMLEECLGRPLSASTSGEVRAPGQHPLHYTVDARVQLVTAQEAPALARELMAQHRRVAIMAPQEVAADLPETIRVPYPAAPEDFARDLYANLRSVDRAAADVVLIVPPDESGIGAAILDRLSRAAGPREPETSQHSLRPAAAKSAARDPK